MASTVDSEGDDASPMATKIFYAGGVMSNKIGRVLGVGPAVPYPLTPLVSPTQPSTEAKFAGQRFFQEHSKLDGILGTVLSTISIGIRQPYDNAVLQAN